MTDVLDRAIKFATEAHSGTFRKGTGIPYILHPLEVAAIVGSMTTDQEIIAAAVLHDTIEDTDITIDIIQEAFGSRVAALVDAESEDKREDAPAEDTWEIRKQETLDHLARETNVAVKMIALGDKLANIRAIHRDYYQIGDALWERFNQKDKNMQGWYYRSIYEVLEELNDYPAYKEYKRLVDEVFPIQYLMHLEAAKPLTQKQCDSLIEMVQVLPDDGSEDILLEFTNLIVDDEADGDEVESIRVQRQGDTYKMVIGYNMEQYDWEESLYLGAEDVPEEVALEILRAVGMNEDSEIADDYIYNHFKNIG